MTLCLYQGLMSQQSSVGPVSGVGQIDVLSNLLQQAQQLQSLQNQLAATTTVSEPEAQPVFNTVSLSLCLWTAIQHNFKYWKMLFFSSHLIFSMVGIRIYLPSLPIKVYYKMNNALYLQRYPAALITCSGYTGPVG